MQGCYAVRSENPPLPTRELIPPASSGPDRELFASKHADVVLRLACGVRIRWMVALAAED